MDGINAPSRAPMSLLSFKTRADLQNYSLGVDSDIGGTSTAHLDFVPNPSDPNGHGHARFWGDMRLGVRSDLRGKVRGGYAGLRSKVTSRVEETKSPTDAVPSHSRVRLCLEN